MTYVLKLDPAAEIGTLDFSPTAPDPVVDFDIYVFKWPTDEEVASSADLATVGEDGGVQLPATRPRSSPPSPAACSTLRPASTPASPAVLQHRQRRNERGHRRQPQHRQRRIERGRRRLY